MVSHTSGPASVTGREIVMVWVAELEREGLQALLEELWHAPVHERRMAVVELLDARGDLLAVEDVALIERLIRESKTWALVDTLAEHGTGKLVVRFPRLNDTLSRRNGRVLGEGLARYFFCRPGEP